MEVFNLGKYEVNKTYEVVFEYKYGLILLLKESKLSHERFFLRVDDYRSYPSVQDCINNYRGFLKPYFDFLSNSDFEIPSDEIIERECTIYNSHEFEVTEEEGVYWVLLFNEFKTWNPWLIYYYMKNLVDMLEACAKKGEN